MVGTETINKIRKVGERMRVYFAAYLWEAGLVFSAGFVIFRLELWSIVQSWPGNIPLTNVLLLTIFGLFGALFINFVFAVTENVGIQKLRQQPSWVHYAYISGLIGPLVATAFFFVSFWPFSRYVIQHWHTYPFALVEVSNIVTACVVWLIYKCIPPRKKFPDMRFAAGSVDADHDEFDFKDSAENVAQSLYKYYEDKKNVTVIALYGGLGFGKSSFARMIIESLNRDEILYTYISLTETNEAKDFSKLFAERWIDSLKERYPKIDTSLVLPALQSILREYGNGFLAKMLSLIPGLDRGLKPTVAKAFDDFGPKNILVSKEVGRLYGNIPNIKEKLWIILIDEIERAQFDEVYRVVEILERFKSEGRTGLPVAMVFLLCISDPDFSRSLDIFAEKDPRAYHIRQAFYQDPKAFHRSIPLPPVQTDKKTAYLSKLLTKVNDVRTLGIEKVIQEAWPDYLSDPERGFFNEHAKAMSYVYGLLVADSPRVMARCVQGVNIFYDTFRSKSGVLETPRIRLSDLIAMEYVKIKYPFLVSFFEKTINLLIDDYGEPGGMTSGGVNAYFKKRELRESKKSLTAWIEETTGVKITEERKGNVERIVALVSYAYIDYLNPGNLQSNNEIYYDSLALPKNLYDYLHLVPDAIVTSYDRYNQIYREYKDSGFDLSTIDNGTLIGFSKFIFDLHSTSVELNLALLSEMADRFVDGRFVIEPSRTEGSLYHDASYQLVFQFVAVLERDNSSDLVSENLERAYACLKKVLLSEKVAMETKFVVLNSLANNTRGQGSEIHARLENSFQRILKFWQKDFTSVISKVFQQLHRRYVSGDEVIYDHESNFFYVLYQGWSGKISETIEISRLRKVAKRGLVDHPEALILYWSRYPFSKDWGELADVFARDPFFTREGNLELFLPLKDLITVTNEYRDRGNALPTDLAEKMAFWQKALNSERFKEVTTLRDDQETLRAVLLRRGYLKKKRVVQSNHFSRAEAGYLKNALTGFVENEASITDLENSTTFSYETRSTEKEQETLDSFLSKYKRWTLHKKLPQTPQGRVFVQLVLRT